jgi:hypothetical protein
VCWLAERERAVPVLWRRLRDVGPDAVPSDAAAQLQRQAMVSEFTMGHLEHRLRDTLAVLSGAGVDAILLKGAALAHTVYPSFVERPMGDVDLLIDQRHADRDPEMDQFYAGHHHLPPLVDARGTGVMLELHTALFAEGGPFRFSADEIRRDARTVVRGGHAVRVPSVAHQLLHLSLHFAWSHMMSGGAWRTFRDLNALVHVGEVNWADFLVLARTSRGGTCCYWTFRLARTLAGVRVPAEVERALRPAVPDSMLRRLEQHFILQVLPTESVCPSVKVGYTMWRLGILPGRSGHGAVRPWGRADDLIPTRGVKTRGVAKLVEQARNVRGWTRYVRTLFGSVRASG